LSPLTERDPIEDYHQMNGELKAYSADLIKKPQIIAPNKIDITEAREKLKKIKTYFNKLGIEVFPISSATGEGLQVLIKEVGKRLEILRN